MEKVLCIKPMGCCERSDDLEWSARLVRPDGSEFRLWYRVHVQWRDRVAADRADAFLVPCIFYAMQNNWNLQVQGEVTTGLVRRLYEFQQVWACWRPDVYHLIQIQAKETPPGPARKTGLITLFSGGLDS